MIRVRNSKTIAAISKKSLKANKSRNIVAICAIALTSILFTSLFTIGGSLLKTMERSTCRQVGTEAHAGYKCLTQSEFDKIKTHPSIKEISYNIFLADAENAALSKVRTEIRYSEDQQAKWGFSYPQTGTMPKAYRDLATSTIVLDALGIPHELGEKVTLDFTVRGKTYQETFNLCGFWTGDPIAGAQSVWLSKEFVLDTAPPSTVPFYERADYDSSGTIFCDMMFANSFDIEGKIAKVTADSGFNSGSINEGVNWAYGGAEVDFTTAALIVMILLLIVSSGYLIIYNIFYISVAKDTRYYGLLKTIGTTGKQLRRIVRTQALYLSCIGIPLGLVLGYGIGALILPIIADTTYYAGQSVLSANALIFAGSALFTLLTVFLSCRKPEKLASTVSPMEALRYYEAVRSKNKKRRTQKVSTRTMAIQNVFRSPKKLISVVLSLSLSVILLNSIYTIVKGFDMDLYLKNSVVSDFAVSNAKLLTQFELDYVDDNTLSTLKSIPGVSETGAVYMAENIHHFDEKATANVQKIIDERLTTDYNSSYTASTIEMFNTDKSCYAHIYGIDKLVFDKLNISGGDKDYTKFLSGDYVYVSAYINGDDSYDYPYYKPGDKVTLDYGNGDTKTYTVLGITSIPSPVSCMHGHFIDPEFILPSEEYLKHAASQTPLHVLLNTKEGMRDAVGESVSAYCDGTGLSFVSKQTKVQEFKDTQNVFTIVGGLLSAILGLIGILNFTNSVLTSIIARRRELAMLQSVGMTTRQLRQMLIYEGLIYALITLLAVFTIGNLIVYFLVQTIAGQIWFFSYRFTLVPMLACLPLMLLFSYLIPILSYRSIRHESIVERLREAE